jgi:hypothetical protein
LALGAWICTPKRPTIFSAGRLVLPQTFAVDLDSGELATGKHDDIRFEALDSQQRFLSALHGSTLKMVGIREWSTKACEVDQITTNQVDITSLVTGTYVLVRTNRGGCSRLTVVAAAGPSPGTLVIDYETWR